MRIIYGAEIDFEPNKIKEYINKPNIDGFLC